ncbi:MAG: carbohydrate kinase family protein [Candidatus Marinimicrobia bacterium]|nr:carbohydrate kinase family protein [Candidatus Neomarinimicrobiota bacterium]
MKIGLIGNIVVDEITMLDGSLTKSWGGAFYSIAIFEKLLKPNERLIPLTPVGYDVWDELQSDLKKFFKIETSALYQENDKNNRVYLKYLNSIEREERADDILPPIETNKFDSVLDADALFFNFISGFEMTIDSLQEVRKTFGGKMLMDFHSLSLGIDEKGYRYKKIPQNWKSWVACFDCVQMNQVEADLIVEYDNDISSHKELVEYLLLSGAEVVNITLGEDGSILGYLEDDKIKLRHLNSEKDIVAVDPTGCGDAYLAAFGLEYIRGSHPVAAAKNANKIAGLVSTLKGIEEIHSTDFSVYGDMISTIK